MQPEEVLLLRQSMDVLADKAACIMRVLADKPDLCEHTAADLARLSGELAAFSQELAGTAVRTVGLHEESTGLDARGFSLHDLVAKLCELESRTRDHAVVRNVCQQVLAIRCRSGSALPRLAECHSRAQTLTDLLEPCALSPEAQEVVSGTHPLCSLLSLTSLRGDLDLSLAGQRLTAVAGAFGPEVAFAAASGLLHVADSEQANVAEAQAGASQEQLAFEKVRTEPEGKVMKGEALDESLPLAESSADSPLLPEPQANIEQPNAAESGDEPTGTELPETQAPALVTDVQNDHVDFGVLALDDPQTSMRDWVWKLVAERRDGMAHHLARSLELHLPQIRQSPPAWLLRALALSGQVWHTEGETVDLLTADFAHCAEFPATGLPELLLLAAASLRPTLLAPNTGAAAVLHELRVDGALYELCRAVAQFGDRYQALDAATLRAVKNADAWRKDLESIRSDASRWLDRAAAVNILYAPATRVWMRWIERGGLIHRLLAPALEDRREAVPTVLEELERLTSDADIRRAIDQTDREQLGRRVGQAITARAFTQMKMHLSDAQGLARHWCQLVSAQAPHRTMSNSDIERLHHKLEPLCQAAVTQLKLLDVPGTPLPLRAAAFRCRESIRDLLGLFDAESPVSADELAPRILMGTELVRIPDLELGATWQPSAETDPSILFSRIRDYLLEGPCDWSVALRAHAERRNHVATGRILACLEAGPDAGLDIAALASDREHQIAACRDALRRDLFDTRSQVEQAVAFGLLTEAERAGYIAQIEEIERSLPLLLEFSPQHAVLSSVRDRIAHKRRQEVEDVRQRLAREVAADDLAHARIAAVLDSGDVITANDYIELVRRREPLPVDALGRDAFLDFFPAKLQAIDRFLEDNGHAEVLRRVSDWTSFAGLDLRPIAGRPAQQAAELLRVWYAAKQRQSIEPEQVLAILEGLGFTPRQARRSTNAGRHWVDVSTEPVEDRTQCPVARYGSDARGQYRVLCTWGRPTEEELLRDVGETVHGVPVLVLYFGRLSERRRRHLARLCLQRRRTFLVLDETLLVFLCAERPPRMAAFFDCSVPFTYLEPFTTTAGLVPPEMFFGREGERHSIMDLHGSCFIFGGRQLGKTALLRSVEREFDHPGEGRIALWLDCKTRGIGTSRPVQDLWPLLAECFKARGVVPPGTNVNVGPDRLLTHIADWLGHDPRRRILLLLDEADALLDADSGTPTQGATARFAVADKLKGLMDQTGRRFKVVFAGLHNVQRTTQLSNHPLAHYGQPICIGPLLDRGESRKARELVERPMAVLGYRFESADLVMRIVSQANYFPSLIQLYCTQLLEHLRQSPSVHDTPASPPYRILPKHVEEANQSRELQQAIRDRLLWTLQLDQRYEVIAYAIAYEFMANRGEAIAEGFSVPSVRQWVQNAWPEGFQERSSEESLRVLLEEMVGLGVLRQTSENRYTLRSPNVLNLMGTQEDMEEALTRKREPALEYEAETFRSAHPQQPHRRSPLTAQQESALRVRGHGVSVAFGLSAAGMQEVSEFLVASFGSEYVVDFSWVPDPVAFERAFSELQRREKEGLTIAMVPPGCPWTEAWISTAVRKMRQLKSKSSFVRVLFLADADTTWRLLDSVQDLSRALAGQDVATLMLRPWGDAALRQWLDDCRLPSGIEDRRRLTELTGNWPCLLSRILVNGTTHQNAHDVVARISSALTSDRGTLRSHFGLDRPASKEALQALADLSPVPVSADELCQLVPKLPSELVRRTLTWADLLGLVQPVSDGKWRMAAIPAALLQHREGAAT